MDASFIKRKILPALTKHEVAVCYLFGSRVKQDYSPDSDVDLGLLFHPFLPSRHTLDLELQIEAELAEILSPLQVDSVFLQKSEIVFRFEVISTGLVLYSRDEEFRTDFEEVTVRDYLDFAPVLRAYYRDLEEEIRGDRQ